MLSERRRRLTRGLRTGLIEADSRQRQGRSGPEATDRTLPMSPELIAIITAAVRGTAAGVFVSGMQTGGTAGEPVGSRPGPCRTTAPSPVRLAQGRAGRRSGGHFLAVPRQGTRFPVIAV